jgi:hypothetical protein
LFTVLSLNVDGLVLLPKRAEMLLAGC